MQRLAGPAAGLLAAALLSGGGPSIRLADVDGRTVWIATQCTAPGMEPDERFAVFVDSVAGAPAMAGSYRVDGSSLVFEPRYPPQPGVRYRAECRIPGAPPVVETFDIPGKDRTPTTVVRQVYPSADKLPENLLKFYVHFSAPMSIGQAYRHIRLLDESGERVELPFLEIDEELWDASQQRLTLLFDPGRIKSGLVPNREAGMALREGRSYRLVIETGWLDANGTPLKRSYEKKFSVVAADTAPPEPDNWRIETPSGGTGPVTIDFEGPLDHALLSRVVGVTTTAGKAVGGSVEISRGETRWSFTPEREWEAGRYQIEVMTILEDLAGNSVSRPFEVDVFEKVEERIVGRTVSIPFAIGSDESHERPGGR